MKLKGSHPALWEPWLYSVSCSEREAFTTQKRRRRRRRGPLGGERGSRYSPARRDEAEEARGMKDGEKGKGKGSH